jgi:hypothetical protein
MASLVPNATRQSVNSRMRWELVVLPSRSAVRIEREDRWILDLGDSHQGQDSLIIRLTCGNTLKSPRGDRTYCVRATASVSAGQQ